MTEAAPQGWNVISDADLLALLQRARSGEDPGLLMTELYANADIERGGDS
jgi:hypothetical protein